MSSDLPQLLRLRMEVISTDAAHTTTERLTGLYGCVDELIRTYRPVYVAIELPAAKGLPPRAQGFSGTPMTITQYAMAVGVAYGRCISPWQDADTRLMVSPPRVMGYPVDTWSRGRGIPGTRDDPYKQKRATYAALVWGGGEGMFGCKTKAKDIADAALLAWVAMSDLEMQSRNQQFRLSGE